MRSTQSCPECAGTGSAGGGEELRPCPRCHADAWQAEVDACVRLAQERLDSAWSLMDAGYNAQAGAVCHVGLQGLGELAGEDAAWLRASYRMLLAIVEPPSVCRIRE